MPLECAHHSGMVANLDSICRKIDQVNKILDIKFEAVQEALKVAKSEMDRRLDGMNHLYSQLNEQRAENRDVIGILSNDVVALKMALAEIKPRVTALEKGTNYREGTKQWSDHIVTVIIAMGVMLIAHYVFKF